MVLHVYCLRGGLKAGKYSTPYVNIGNLFDYTAALTNANNWLADLDDIEFEERVAPALFDLLDLKGDDRISLVDGKLWLRQSGQESELYKSSDGYRGIVALACDLMKSLTFKNESYHVSKGIVLIDELGNHLHPRWRMKIVKALRTAFPRVQFIVSTHEPLCLRGLSHGEVNVMVRDRSNAVRILGAELLPDHNQLRIDQLLTSDLFGLINTLDTDTEKKFEDYYQLLATPEKKLSKSEKQKLDHLNKELAEKEMVGPTPQMQTLYRIVNEKFATKLEENEFKTKTQISDETAEEIKEMLNNKDFSWL